MIPLGALAGLPWGLIGRAGIVAGALALGYCQGGEAMREKWDKAELERIAAFNAAEIEAMRGAHKIELDQETNRARMDERRANALEAANERADTAEAAAQQTRSRNYALSQNLKDQQAAAIEAGDLCGPQPLNDGLREHFADRLKSLYSDRRPAADMRNGDRPNFYGAPIDGNPELAGPRHP